jgi:hypothetical protein
MTLALAVCASTISAAANAEVTDFFRCDGYEAPNAKTDNMIRVSSLFGSTRSDIRKTVQRLGPDGVVACDVALADPILLPKFWLRRSNLLQAKAAHQIASGNSEEGLITLDKSNSLGAANAATMLFDISVGVGNRALKAFAYQALWRNDDARKEIDAIKALRKWSPTNLKLASDLEIRLAPGYETLLKVARSQIPLDPNSAIAAHRLALTFGLLKDAENYGSAASFDLPVVGGNYYLSSADRLKMEIVEARAALSGGRAYALSAIGDDAGSGKILRTAREMLALNAAPIVTKEGKKISKRALADYDRRQTASDLANAKLQQWEDLIAVRKKIPTVSFDEAGKLLDAQYEKKNNFLYLVVADLTSQMKTNDAESLAQKKAFIEQLHSTSASAIGKALSKSADDFMSLLPRPESPELIPTFKKAGDGYFLSDNGLSHRVDGDGTTHLVRFTHIAATKETIEEMVLLGAARLAKTEGKDSLLIMTRSILPRSITGYGVNTNMGHEAQIKVVFVDSKTLPAELESHRWRLVPVAPILADLESRYIQPEPPK